MLGEWATLPEDEPGEFVNGLLEGETEGSLDVPSFILAPLAPLRFLFASSAGLHPIQPPLPSRGSPCEYRKAEGAMRRRGGWRGGRRVLALGVLALALVLLFWVVPGCGLLGSTGAAGVTSGGDTTAACLPDPAEWRVPPPMLTADQQVRQDEVCRYLVKEYQAEGWVIKETKQTPKGTIIDCLDAASVQGSDAEPPPPIPPEDLVPAPGYQLQVSEVDGHPELQCPNGTIFMVRDSFAPYVLGGTGAVDVEDWVNNYQVSGVPAGQNRLYGGIGTQVPNIGAVTWVTAFDGKIEPGSMSLLEMLVGCRDASGNMVQQVGIAASRDDRNFGNSVLRLQVEFLTAGEKVQGDSKGGWVGTTIRGIIPASFRPYGPGVALIPSTVGGVQYESRFDIQLQNGNWWVAHNGHWLGYFEGKLFNSGADGGTDGATDGGADGGAPVITKLSCEATWYAEVFNPHKDHWTWTDMASGEFSYKGAGYATSFRNPAYRDTSGQYQWPDNFTYRGPVDSTCYTTDPYSSGQAPWVRWFYVGGPGADSPEQPGSMTCKYGP